MSLNAAVIVTPSSSSDPTDLVATVTVTNTDLVPINFNPAPFFSSSITLEIQDPGFANAVSQGPPGVPDGGEPPQVLGPAGSGTESIQYVFANFMPDNQDLLPHSPGSPVTYHVRVNTFVNVPYGAPGDTPLQSPFFDITLA